MVRKAVMYAALLIALAPAMVLLLFAATPAISNSFVGGFLCEVRSVVRDAGTQRMLFLTLGVYFVAFSIRRPKLSAVGIRNSNTWLLGLFLVGTVVYAMCASTSDQALTLLAGATVGKGAAALVRTGKWTEGRSSRAVLILLVLTVLLSIASFWNGGSLERFAYQTCSRWNGPWKDPNLAGLLMGAGVMLAVGLAVFSFQFSVFSKAEAREGESQGWKHWPRFLALLCLVAAALMGRGLWHSYSRGAWVATGCGLAYVIVKAEGRRKKAETAECGNMGTKVGRAPFGSSLLRNWFPVAVIFVSVLVLAFWQVGSSKRSVLADRVVSVVNANDFSWRNRVAAWKGALQIMAEHPWLGVGWNRPERLYANYYLPAKLDESAAIQMNDYLMLGATLGVPALMCFLIYLFLSLRSGSIRVSRVESGVAPDSSKTQTSSQENLVERGFRRDAENGVRDARAPHLSLETICRAGAIVLAVGFWFDGGLFKLATASTFWILLELGRGDFTAETRRRGGQAEDEASLSLARH